MKRLIALFFVCRFFLTAAGAASASGDTGTASPAMCSGCSPWAEEEIAEAAELGFIPIGLAGSWQAGITRADFADAAVQFLAAQFGLDPESLLPELIEKTGIRVETNPFSDADGYRIRTAYGFGVITGRGNGMFDPDSLITREEAAAVLMRTYRAYAAVLLYADLPARPFSDWEEISSWAREDAAQVYAWGVMKGISDTTFDPKGAYTREQCFVTFLRMWNNMPSSRAKGTVRSLGGHEGNRVEPEVFLSLTVGEIRKAYGEPKLEYSEHGPGAPVYSLGAVPGVTLLFTGHSMSVPLTDDMIPSAVLLGGPGVSWRGITIGSDLSEYGRDIWTNAWCSVSDGTVSVEGKMGNLRFYCVTGNPEPYFMEDRMDYDSWKQDFLAQPRGTIHQIRISRAEP